MWPQLYTPPLKVQSFELLIGKESSLIPSLQPIGRFRAQIYKVCCTI